MTRNLYLTIENRLSWDSPLDLWGSEDTIAELVFWKTNIRSLNIRKLLEYLPQRLLGYSDARDKACGAFMVSCDNIVSHKMWSPDEEIMGSKWRELRAKNYALLSFLPLLKGQNVHWHSDNQGTISVAKFRSAKIHLQKLALDVFFFICT